MEHSATQSPRLLGIKSKQDLANTLAIPLDLLEKRAFNTNQHLYYTKSLHKKRDGSYRPIYSPFWPLKNLQSKIAKLLEEFYRPSSRVTGFVKGGGIKKNAQLHLGKRMILNFDLEDFFPTIHFGRVRGRLMAAPYGLSSSVATTIARLCTLDGALPIGAPSSPILANIVASHLDGLLSTLARENGCFYSRYADDITFSTNRKSLPRALVVRDDLSGRFQAGAVLVETVKKAGFSINPRKTRLLDKSTRQEVSGVTINEFLNVRRRFYRDVRGALHAIERYGIEEAENFFFAKYNWRGSVSLESHLRGRLTHLIHIRGHDDLVVWRLIDRYNQLADRKMKKISYTEPKNERDRLVQSVCRIEAANEAIFDPTNPDLQEFNQGTGIKLPSGRILTNLHNVIIEKEIAPEIKIFPFEGSDFYIETRLLKSDSSKDVAILEPIDNSWISLISKDAAELSFQPCKIGQKVALVGYPNYKDGDSCNLVFAQITGFAEFDSIEHFRISTPIVKGNSGGPLFNEYGHVIAVASRGLAEGDNVSYYHNGCLELNKIEKFIKDQD